MFGSVRGWLGGLVALLGALVAAGCGTTRAGYATAPYRVLLTEGQFQLREYPALVLAETPMRSADDGFGRLFRFISGQNATQEKIAMTTPVYFSTAAAGATGAPGVGAVGAVGATGTAGTAGASGAAPEMMAFVLPEGVAAKTAPRPSDPLVTVRETAGGTFAVLRFSGSRSAQTQALMLGKLETWLAQQNVSPTGRPIYGYFDPPWTPPFLRRNEVMLPVAR